MPRNVTIQVEQPCTSLSMSPTGDYLATTHVGELGVFMWANRLLYEKIFLKPIDRDTVNIPKLSEYLSSNIKDLCPKKWV